MRHPIVSVIIPTFNAERYLVSALRSMQMQDYEDFEILAIDDGSTDGSLSILQQFAQSDSRFRVFACEHRGLTATLNEGLSLAQGDLIARMDADDISYPGRLTAQVSAFEADPSLALCGCHYDRIWRDKLLSAQPLSCTDNTRGLAVLSLFYTMLLHPTVMFRRSSIDTTDFFYDPDYPFAEDFELFRRIARKYVVKYIPEPLLAYRLHSGSASSIHKATMLRTHLRIVEENFRVANLGVSADGISEIADVVREDSIIRACAFISEVDALARRSPPSLRPAIVAGSNNLFDLFYSIILNNADPSLLRLYFDISGWKHLRRRERYILRPFSGLKTTILAIKFIRAMEDTISWLSAPPVRRSIAHYEYLHC